MEKVMSTPMITPKRRFEGQTVIITGAGSGIGWATAQRVAHEGGRVVAVDINQERLDALSEELHNYTVHTVRADVSSEEDIVAIMDCAGNTIDALINNAGIMDGFEPLHEVNDDVWERVMRINVDSVMRLSRAVLPYMLEAGSGAIVNVVSEAALRGSAAGAAYTASKHAVVGLTLSGAAIYTPLGIRINAVAPGGTRTNIVAQPASALGADRVFKIAGAIGARVAEAREVAAAITFLASDDASNISGAVLPSDDGWSAV